MKPLNNLSLPLVAAPLFLISGPSLVIECCKNGIVGTFPALNQRSSQGLEEWIVQIKSELEQFEEESGKKAAPFGVNLIVHHSNARIMADMQIIVKHQVPIVITSLGAVSDLVEAVHSYGGLVFHDVIKKRHAEKAAEAGVDGLILVSAGAGGHGGTLNPVPFIHEIKDFFKGTILLAGTLSNGQDIASAMQMGADLAYMGTRFINTLEANVEKEYQSMIIESKTTDIVYTAAVSGVNANFMSKSLTNAGFNKEDWENKAKIDFGKELDAAKAEAKAWKTIWSAGQGVTAIQDVPSVSDLVKTMRKEFKAALQNQNKLLDNYNL